MSLSRFNPRVQRAATIIQCGGVVAYPTEAVWGLGCDPFDESAVNRILRLKRRARGMGLILIAANIQQLSPLLRGLSSEHLQTLDRSWPGPNTWLIPDNGVAPHWVTGGRATLAVRVTGQPVAKALCQAFDGPIVSTSANPHGYPAATSLLKTRIYFKDQLDDTLPGQVGSYNKPSEIRDLQTGQVIRPG